MKKLCRIHLHDDVVLSDNEMKKVLGGSGADGKVYTYDCLCTEPKADDSGTLPPADKRVTVTASGILDAANKAANSCSGYKKIDCAKV